MRFVDIHHVGLIRLWRILVHSEIICQKLIELQREIFCDPQGFLSWLELLCALNDPGAVHRELETRNRLRNLDSNKAVISRIFRYLIKEEE
jgi:hypothetical protein